jgi:hypothetical protein
MGVRRAGNIRCGEEAKRELVYEEREDEVVCSTMHDDMKQLAADFVN